MPECSFSSVVAQSIIDQIEGGQISEYTLREFLESAIRSPLSSQISSAISSINSNINSSKNEIKQCIHTELTEHLSNFSDFQKAVLEILIKNAMVSQHTNMLLTVLSGELLGKKRLDEILKELAK